MYCSFICYLNNMDMNDNPSYVDDIINKEYNFVKAVEMEKKASEYMEKIKEDDKLCEKIKIAIETKMNLSGCKMKDSSSKKENAPFSYFEKQMERFVDDSDFSCAMEVMGAFYEGFASAMHEMNLINNHKDFDDFADLMCEKAYKSYLNVRERIREKLDNKEG